MRFGRIGSSSARSSPPSRRRTRGPPETAWRFQPNLLRSHGLDVQTRLALERCRFLAAGPLGMETYGPRTTFLALERLSMVQALATSIEWPCASPSVPASRFHTAIHGVRLCLRLGVHALAIPVPSSPAIANGPSDSSRGRILLRHCGGIVPPLFSSNILDNASRHPRRPCNIGTSTEVPPDLKRFYFGCVYCPAVSVIRRFDNLDFLPRPMEPKLLDIC